MKPQQIEQTGKGLKFIQLLAVLMFIFGIVMFFTGNGGFLPMMLGTVVYFIARIAAWWDHG
jgi:hypothetical protein